MCGNRHRKCLVIDSALQHQPFEPIREQNFQLLQFDWMPSCYWVLHISRNLQPYPHFMDSLTNYSNTIIDTGQ